MGRKKSSPSKHKRSNAMNVNTISPFQALQNVYSPNAGRISNANSGEIDPLQAQSVGITASISNLQGQLENLNVVHDPPFFPIARYQRVDLITKIRGIHQEIGQSSLPPEVKQPVSANKLKNDATDSEIGIAIGKLFAIRNILTQSR
jgi:hypothetical protein